MIKHLWVSRSRPALFSHAWLKTWAKRVWTTPRLVRICHGAYWLRRRGATLGALSVANGLDVNGKAHKIRIGHHSFIAPGVHVTSHGGVSIGAHVAVNSGVRLLSATHDLSDPSWRMVCRGIDIADYAWIATGATILPGVSVGVGAVVGAGAVVAVDVPAHALAVGNPAVIIANKRTKRLEYDPVAFISPFEAWLGSSPQTGIESFVTLNRADAHSVPNPTDSGSA